MEIIRSKKESLPDIAGKLLIKKVSVKDPVLLLLSGGSALSILDHAKEVLNHPNLMISMLDDRAVADPTKSNFSKMLGTSFGHVLMAKGIPFIDTRLFPKESPTQMLKRFENGILSWCRKNPTGKIVATVGVGEDGHIAGIFPFSKSPKIFNDLFLSEEIAVCYDARGKHEIPIRMTVTCTFLKERVFSAIAYVVGDNKKNAIDSILAENGDMAVTPSRVLREMKDVTFVTDYQ